MRRFLVLFSLAFITFSCHKNDDGGGNPGPGPGSGSDPDYTPLPAAENINTEIIGYVTNDQNQLLTGPNLFHLLTPINTSTSYILMGNGMAYTGNIITDKTITRVLVETGGGWNYMNTLKIFPVSSSIKNYTRIKVLNRSSIGNVRNGTGGIYTISGTANITYGVNTFYQTPTGIYPGYFSPDIYSDIFCTYFDPEFKEFALRLPCYLAGDDAQKRWFLKSYGAISLRMNSSSSTGDNIDFYNGGTADLKLPIPASMQAGAPDSVNTWQLNNGLWAKAGWATKQGNFYTAKIGKATAWTFAQPVKGVYLTVNLRTDSNAILPNTAVRIKSGNRVIAESQTDADGNAVCFVPTNESLTAEIIPDEKVYSLNTYSYSIGTVTKVSSVTVKLPSSTPELTSIIGKVFNCNGDPVNNGIAKIKLDALGTEYFVPVKNGRFAAALWLYGTNNGVRVEITDNATGGVGDITPVTLFYGDIQHVNFYSCQNSPLLYCNYKVDNTSYELTDNANSPTVYMIGARPTPFANPAIKTNNGNNRGVSFNAWPAMIGVWGAGIFDIVVNGNSYQFDVSKDATVSYTRFDGVMNGYLEGWFSFYYLDNANASHHVTGNFKVKRTF